MPKKKREEPAPEPPAAEAPAEVKEKKKRTANPGVRVQGGRIYDSETGTTCHQCRQKTVEVKAKCTSCTLHWCPRCLSNRYGEEVAQVATLTEWPCPRCRGACNCSNCRKRNGLEATGILAGVCRAAGLSSVSELLVKNPTAKRAALAPADAAAPKAPRADKPARRQAAPQQQPASAQVPDEQLGDRPAPFPAGEALQIHAPKQTARQTRGARWPAQLGAALAIPEDCAPGDLAEVLEFLHVFGGCLGSASLDLAAFAAELVRLPQLDACFPEGAGSQVAAVHTRLLDAVRRDWGLKGVGEAGWQGAMRAYLRQERAAAAAALAQLQPDAAALAPAALAAPSVDGAPICPAVAAEHELASDPACRLPDGGYWALPPGARLRMLRALCHDALGSAAVRDAMQAAQEASIAAAREQQSEAAAARKEARAALQRERDRQVALLISGDAGAALTAEQQRELMQAAQAKAAAAAGGEAGAEAAAAHPMLRSLPLGQEREGRLIWRLQAAAVLSGGQDGVFVARPWQAVGSDQWRWQGDVALLAAALDGSGQAEGQLKQQLQRAFSLPQRPAATEAAAEQPAAAKAETGAGGKGKAPVSKKQRKAGKENAAGRKVAA